jgi:hypothetical protein
MKTQIRMTREDITYSSVPEIVWTGDIDSTVSLQAGSPIILAEGTAFVTMFGLLIMGDEPVKLIYVRQTTPRI